MYFEKPPLGGGLLPAAPPLDFGPGRFGLSPERDPLFGSLRLEPRGKAPPDDFPSLEPAVASEIGIEGFNTENMKLKTCLDF